MLKFEVIYFIEKSMFLQHTFALLVYYKLVGFFQPSICLSAKQENIKVQAYKFILLNCPKGWNPPHLINLEITHFKCILKTEV